MSYAKSLVTKEKVFIIAETCSNIIPHLNHLSDVVRRVAATGADAVKVQLFKAEHFPWSEQESKRRIEFPRDLFPELVQLCHENNLACGASVFDEDAVDLVEDSGADFLKLATREWGNIPLVDRCLESKLYVIRSYDALAIPYLDPGDWSNGELLMACIPQYPAVNFRLPTSSLLDLGWSSHTQHWNDCLMAVARGVIAIEKHIAFSSNDYEYGWSLNCMNFDRMVEDIRWAESVR